MNNDVYVIVLIFFHLQFTVTLVPFLLLWLTVLSLYHATGDAAGSECCSFSNWSKPGSVQCVQTAYHTEGSGNPSRGQLAQRWGSIILKALGMHNILVTYWITYLLLSIGWYWIFSCVFTFLLILQYFCHVMLT